MDGLIDRYGPWAIIAGGSEGIGPAYAERLAAQGFKLLLLARKAGPLEEAASYVRKRFGTEVRSLPIDLTGEDAMPRIVGATEDCDVGLVIYNAGADGPMLPFLDRALSNAEQLIALNVLTPMRLAYHFAPKMAKRGRGGIVFSSSVAAVAGTPGAAVYSGAKAFLDLFSEAVWHEFGQLGIDVLCAILPFVKTPAMERLGFRLDSAVQPEDPFAIADQVLGNLQNGPALHGGASPDFMMLLRSLPRQEAVKKMMEMGAATGAMSEDLLKDRAVLS